jgi:hypothetical protein
MYIIEPLVCRDLANAAVCVDSFGVAGNVATVIVAILGVFALVRNLQPRPIIIAVAAAAVLWGLGQYRLVCRAIRCNVCTFWYGCAHCVVPGCGYYGNTYGGRCPNSSRFIVNTSDIL